MPPITCIRFRLSSPQFLSLPLPQTFLLIPLCSFMSAHFRHVHVSAFMSAGFLSFPLSRSWRKGCTRARTRFCRRFRHSRACPWIKEARSMLEQNGHSHCKDRQSSHQSWPGNDGLGGEASTWMLDDVVKLLKKSRWEVTHNHSWKMPRPDSLPWNNQQGKTHQDTLTSCVSDVKLVSVKETTHFDKVMQDMKENHGHTTSHLNAVQSIVQPLSSRCPEDGRKGR